MSAYSASRHRAASASGDAATTVAADQAQIGVASRRSDGASANRDASSSLAALQAQAAKADDEVNALIAERNAIEAENNCGIEETGSGDFTGLAADTLEIAKLRAEIAMLLGNTDPCSMWSTQGHQYDRTTLPVQRWSV